MGKDIKRILDTSEINMNLDFLRQKLEIELDQMEKSYLHAPATADAYHVRVLASKNIHRLNSRWFNFEVQYGYLRGSKFLPISEKEVYPSRHEI